MTGVPRLSEVNTDSDDFESLLKSFICRSTPVAARARLDHASELRLLDQPWWRKLGDEYQDSKYRVEDNEDDNSWKVF